MPVLEMTKKAVGRQVAAEEVDDQDWSAHDNCLHIPNARTIKAMEDVRLRRNLYGPFATAKEAVEHMLAHMDEDDEEDEV